MLKFSILIPEWPDVKRPLAMDYIDQLDCPQGNLEIIIANGFQPSRQRNTAAQKAKGEILIFFDNDSCPKPIYLQQLSRHFDDPNVSAVGGPNPALPTNNYLPNLVEAVLTSRIAILSKATRYKPTGTLRQARDSELILCNFAMRRADYLALGGLHESLCPNEENEFFERFHRQLPGKKILYDPELIAYEPRPPTLRAFLRKMFGYGRGRARQFKINPSLWSLVHVLGGCLAPILPLLFVLAFGFKALLYLFAPYVALLLIQGLTSLVRQRRPAIALGIAPLTAATHLTYTLGLWAGLFSSLKPTAKAKHPIKLEYYKSPDVTKCQKDPEHSENTDKARETRCA